MPASLALSRPAQNRSLWSRVLGWLAALMGLAVTSLAMLAHGVDFSQQGWLLLATVVQTVLPGLALTTWLRRPTLLEWVAVAFVLGLPVQLLGWLIGVTTGNPMWMWVVPLAVAVVGLGLTAKRQVRNFRQRSHIPVLPGLVVLVVWVVTVSRIAEHWTNHPNGELAGAWYQDLYWHLGINASALHRIPLQDPQAIGEQLNYHWLTNAHIAALARSANLDLEALSAGAWNFAPLFAMVGMTFGLTRYISRSMWASVLAVVLIRVSPQFFINPAVRSEAFWVLVPLSPSHTLGVPVTLVVVWLILTILKGGIARRRAAWLPLAMSLLFVAGVKVSALPVFACGVIAAGLPALLARHARVRVLVVLAMVAGALILTFPLFGGGGGGSVVKWGVPLKRYRIWGDSREAIEALSSGDVSLTINLFALLLALNALAMLPGVFAMKWKDTTGWLLAGVISSALGVTFVLAHPGRSELYFAWGVHPLMAVAMSVGIAYLVRGVGPGFRAQLVMVAIGALWIGGIVNTMSAWNYLALRFMWRGLGVIAGLAVVAAFVIWRLGWRRGSAAVGVAMLAFSSAWGLHHVTDGARLPHLVPNYVRSQQQPKHDKPDYLTPDEIDAMQFLAALPPDVVVATNVHCMAVETTPFCDARAFWVAGLGKHRVLLGGWGYTNLGRSTQGQYGGRPHSRNPYPDQELFRLNQRAFETPNSNDIREIKSRGVTHMFASKRASAVGDLSPWCATEFENSSTLICELK